MNPEFWPCDSAEAGLFIDNLGRIIRNLSPLEEASDFPRLAELRWMAIGFDALVQEPGGSEGGDFDQSPYNLALQLRGITEEKPIFTDSNLMNSISSLEVQLLARAKLLENQDIDLHLSQVGQFLESTTPGMVEYSAVEDRIFEHLDYLSYYMEVRLDRQGEISVALAQLEERLALIEQDLLGRPMREYQAWALERIWDFEQRLEVIKENFEESGFFNSLTGELTEQGYREIQEAMIQYLAPIDQSLLEMPVLRRFQIVFEAGWNELDEQDGKYAQDCVAIASAIVTKQALNGGTEVEALFNRFSTSTLWEARRCAQ